MGARSWTKRDPRNIFLWGCNRLFMSIVPREIWRRFRQRVLDNTFYILFYIAFVKLYRFVKNSKSFGRKINRKKLLRALCGSQRWVTWRFVNEKASWRSIRVSRQNARNRRPSKPIRNNQSNGSGPNVNLDVAALNQHGWYSELVLFGHRHLSPHRSTDNRAPSETLSTLRRRKSVVV